MTPAPCDHADRVYDARTYLGPRGATLPMATWTCRLCGQRGSGGPVPITGSPGAATDPPLGDLEMYGHVGSDLMGDRA